MSDSPQQPAEDKSRFIRTYAKDVAALTGTSGKAASAPPPPPVPKPVAAPPPPPPKPIPPPPPLEKPEFEAPAPPPAPLPPVNRAPEQPSPIHTYKSDFADRIDQKQASTFSVLAAQKDAGKRPASPKKRRSQLMLAGAVVLIALGGAGLGGAAWYVMRANMLPAAVPSASSLVFADEQVRLSASGPDLMNEIAALANEPLPDGSVLVVYLSESTTTERGRVIETPLSGGALINAMELPAPQILLRNISPESTVGIMSAGGETRPFFVFKTSSYERTFAGMLAWETSIARDLAVLFPAKAAGSLAPTAASAPLGTSTPVAQPPARPLDAFTDAVVANHDVRVLRDTAGATLMLYGYAQKDLLILARDEAAFTNLISRLSSGD
ncbi:MAG TPA: hypothetical protein VEA36_02230 [Candidatus Paceibacterota bacterium]|nr:hypothetical protein [Candidatus Paceibacterota bacterium]